MSDYPPSFCDTRYPKARKEHRCSECGRIIPRGEGYEYTVGVWSGDFCYFKTCDECQHLRSILLDWNREMVFYGELHAGLWEAEACGLKLPPLLKLATGYEGYDDE